MKKLGFLSAVALLSLAGMIGVGCAAQVDEAVSDPEDHEALAKAPDVNITSEAFALDCHLDGCNNPHDSCTCANTGWSGYCGTGPHHPGCLYCRCD